jgi:predicted dehydrogenase
MANKTWRVGIIGRTGKGDYGHAVDVACAKTPGVEIVGVADEHEGGRLAAQKRVNAPKVFADFRAMIADTKPDIVAICPRWIDQHKEMLLAAAEGGCHVYMEKPFCPTLAECDEVVRAFEMRHLKLGIAHITQYSPILRMVGSLIRGGEIGDVLELRGRGKEDAKRGGGEDTWVLGSHIFGIMRTLGGGDPLTCSAVVMDKGRPTTKGDVLAGAEGIGPLAGDNIQARYQFPGGLFGHFASRRGAAGSPTRFALQVFGSKGVIELESGYMPPAHILRDSSWSPGRTGKTWEKISSAGIGKPEPIEKTDYEAGHIAAITDLIAAIEGGRQTLCSYEDARGITQMIAAIFESHRQGGGPVELPLKTRVNPLTLVG